MTLEAFTRVRTHIVVDLGSGCSKGHIFLFLLLGPFCPCVPRPDETLPPLLHPWPWLASPLLHFILTSIFDFIFTMKMDAADTSNQITVCKVT
jgi:hypothetical protein